MARLVIGVGLTAKVPEVTGLATDAVIAAIDDGRIDAARLGESLRTVWRWEVPRSTRETSQGPNIVEGSVGFARSNRWAKTLGDVVRASKLHAHVIACALEQVLADEATGRRTSASVVPLLELLREASVTCGRAVSAEVRAYLETIGTAGKTGRVVKSLLELQDVPDSRHERRAGRSGTRKPDRSSRAVDGVGARAVLSYLRAPVRRHRRALRIRAGGSQPGNGYVAHRIDVDLDPRHRLPAGHISSGAA